MLSVPVNVPASADCKLAFNTVMSTVVFGVPPHVVEVLLATNAALVVTIPSVMATVLISTLYGSVEVGPVSSNVPSTVPSSKLTV